MMPRDESDLFRLVYRSRLAVTDTPGSERRAIEAILAVSRRRNALAGVTGALLFTGKYFVQALEGGAAEVERTFDRICCDLRHTGVEVIECGPVLEPAFGQGWMSHLVPDAGADALLDPAMDEIEIADAAASAMKLMAALIRSQFQEAAPGQAGRGSEGAEAARCRLVPA